MSDNSVVHVALVIALVALGCSLALLAWSLRRLSALRQAQQALSASRAELAAQLERLRREHLCEREQQRQATLEGLLDIDDHVQRAVLAISDEHAGPRALQASNEGLLLLARELDRSWRRAGLTRIRPSVGERFDPQLHEAVAAEPGDEVSEPLVERIERDGFRCDERLMRAARVVVRVPSKQA